MLEDPNLIMKRQVMAYWQQEPLNRPVKITSVVREPMLWADGYITCYKFVVGHTLFEVERLLGLHESELSGGAYRYEFMRLPTAADFELRGYSQCPNGEVWTPDSKYPVGLGVPQWQIGRQACIASRLAAIVAPGERVR